MRRRLLAVAGTALLLAAIALADAALALELAPAGLLVALAAAGWMPGEERLVRAMRRRRSPAPRPRPVALLLRGPQVLLARGRRATAGGGVRGPPRPAVPRRTPAPVRGRCARPATSPA
ncbi:unannotated protein [freshwater metagenome]|uniref:Unannotated protein n=1 Tax=freshwater metagenome TaxID=449393 RepID=A0A6J7H2T1_9ZZZZ